MKPGLLDSKRHVCPQDTPQGTCGTNAIRLGIFAGEGELPVAVARSAVAQGYQVYVYCLDKASLRHFKPWIPADRLRFIRYGLLKHNTELIHSHGIQQAVFAGKVNKWILLKSPMFDSRAFRIWQSLRHFNDDALMLRVVQEFEQEGIEIVPQTQFMPNLLAKPGLYSKRPPTPEEQRDIDLGMRLAKEMGRLDIGQTVVVSQGMVLAVETIEGTDQAIRRSRKWSHGKGGVVAKVEKPNQDLRFDVPTVGPRTLAAMKKAGLTVLAVEADKTILLHQARMVELADQWQMTLVAV